jgi:putative ABC transport system ATP-binding protein
MEIEIMPTLSLSTAPHAGNEPAQLIALRQVVKVYVTGAQQFTALKGVDLAVRAGEFVAVVGKSGSGKSTLLNMITGIDHPTSGEVWVNGAPLHTYNEDPHGRLARRNLAWCSSFFSFCPTLTVAENIMLPMDFCHIGSSRERRERAMALLAQVEMQDQADKLPRRYPAGSSSGWPLPVPWPTTRR